MPERDEYISLIKPPGYEVPGHTEHYHIVDYSKLSIAQRLKHLSMPLLEGIIPAIQEELVELAKTSKLTDALSVVANEIRNTGQGYLFRITEIVDPEGTVTLASAPVSFIGFGDTPVDALAISYMGEQISTEVTGGKIRTSFKWCTASGNDLSITCADTALGKHLIQSAKIEANRRQIRNIHMTSAPIQRALQTRTKYWSELMKHKAAQLRETGLQQSLLTWQAKFEEAANAFNKAYESYLSTSRELAKQAKDAAFWSKVNTVLGALQTAESIQGRFEQETAAKARQEYLDQQLQQIKDDVNQKRKIVIQIDNTIIIKSDPVIKNPQIFKLPDLM